MNIWIKRFSKIDLRKFASFLIINTFFIPQLFAPPITRTVSSLANAGVGTLRQAITDTNGNNPGAGNQNLINFSIAGTITPATDLPTIVEPLLLDGQTAPGWTPNTNPITAANNAHITIEIRGPGAGVSLPVTNGLRLGAGSDGSTIRGLCINNFANAFVSAPNTLTTGVGIRIDSSNNIIEGCFIGSDTTGEISLPCFDALRVSTTADSTLIGGSTPVARNLLSGQYGGNGVIRVNGTNTTIRGNTVGLDALGTTALMPAARVGIIFNAFTTGLTIGGPDPEDANVIAGHDGANIASRGNDNVLIQGNFIGTDVSGTANPGFNGLGIWIADAPTTGPVSIKIDNNLISGNTWGVIIGENADNEFVVIGAQVTNNKIGTDVSGTLPLENTIDGIRLKFAQNTYIAFNTISSNARHGIYLGKAKATNIKGNFIGTDSSGTLLLGNDGDGIRLGSVGVGVPAFDDIIGGAVPGDGNIISNNGQNGISIIGNTEQETIQGNIIQNNTLNGIYVGPHSSNNWIGGFRTEGNLLVIGDLSSQGATNLGPLGTSNIISGNKQFGIQVKDSNTNTLQTNIITANTNDGISLVDSSHNLVGGEFGGSSTIYPPFLLFEGVLGNSITGNGGPGVTVEQDTGNATDNSILSNQIVDNAGNGIQFVG